METVRMEQIGDIFHIVELTDLSNKRVRVLWLKNSHRTKNIKEEFFGHWEIEELAPIFDGSPIITCIKHCWEKTREEIQNGRFTSQGGSHLSRSMAKKRKVALSLKHEKLEIKQTTKELFLVGTKEEIRWKWSALEERSMASLTVIWTANPWW